MIRIIHPRARRAKADRQRLLRRIIARHAVTSQSQLVALLTKSGVEATQASVSRDMRELGCVKLDGRYTLAERLAGPPRAGSGRDGSGLIDSVDVAGAHLIVVRTPVGAANAAAVELDRMRLPDVVGTVAGDDTFFVAVRSRAAQGRVVATLRSLMPRRSARPRGRG